MTKGFAIDNISLLFLARIQKNYTNVFRFSMTFQEPVRPDILQTAVDHTYPRFPTVIAGFHPGFFQYTQVPVSQPPKVLPDPGCLITMSLSEIHKCAFRVYYKENTVSFEAFHALTDGAGALSCITTLVAEYLRLLYGAEIPVNQTLLDLSQEPTQEETGDALLTHQAGKPFLIPSRYSYQLPGEKNQQWQISSTAHSYPTKSILDAAHRYGVSATTLLTTVMASSIMEIQQSHKKRLLPVRIMVPVDLRRIFSSKTLRNFSLYALPAMEPEEIRLPMEDLMQKFHNDIRSQIDKDRLASMMAYYVRTQSNPLFRYIPRGLKFACLRLGYRFFGESNSSVTVTNLGNFKLPEEMASYIQSVEVIMTPRVQSPYGCSIISYGDTLTVNISTFRRKSELDEVFDRNLTRLLT